VYCNSCTACSKSASMLWLPRLMICSAGTTIQQTTSAAQLAHRLHDDLQCSYSYSADYNSNNACSKSASMLWLPRLMICSAGTAIQQTRTAFSMYCSSCTACSKSAFILWLPKLMICSAGTAIQLTTTAALPAQSQQQRCLLKVCVYAMASQADDLQCRYSYSVCYNSSTAYSQIRSMLWLPNLMICSAGTAVHYTTTAALPAQRFHLRCGCLSW